MRAHCWGRQDGLSSFLTFQEAEAGSLSPGITEDELVTGRMELTGPELLGSRSSPNSKLPIFTSTVQREKITPILWIRKWKLRDVL